MKKLRKLKKGLAILLTAAMVVGLMPGVGTLQVSAAESDENTVNTVSSNEAMTPEPTPEQTDGQATEKLITAWQWIDEEEYLDEETGSLSLPGASEQRPAYFDDVTAFLPTQIQATVEDAEDTEAESGEEIINLGDWNCEDYPEKGAYTGSYTFTAALPEGYALYEEADALEVLVELGGAQMYETAEYVNGFCQTYNATKRDCSNTNHTDCSGYQPATLTNDKYDIDGDEVQDNVYEISNAGQLYWFADKVNTENDTYGSANAVLTADITVNEGVLNPDGTLADGTSEFKIWTPIGNRPANKYIGIFDGQNHTVNGLYFNDTSTEKVGLFGYVGNVKDENENVTSAGKVSNVGVVDSCFNGKSMVGGVCGMNYGTIENCYNKGTVSGSGVGGVCGMNYGTITNSYNTGSVSSSSTYVGGVCGANYSGTIENCYNSGTVSGTGDYVGGVCGMNYDTIENCYNSGTVSGKNSVGGVCGLSRGTIENCYNKGEVNGTGNASFGGVCGESSGTITNCYNTGNVSGTGNYFGGVCGLSRGTITNCHNTGTVSGSGSCAGGVCGENYGTIKNCYNTGTVSGTNDVGGVCGENYGTITNCYNTGAVSGSYYVGGVCGLSSGTITNCYYLEGTTADSNATDKTEAQFNSGEVAYLLSKGCTIGEGESAVTYDGSIWGQKLNNDMYPVLKKTEDEGNTVYQNIVYSGCSESNQGDTTYVYANEAAAPIYAEHIDADGDGVCDTCSEVINAYEQLQTLIASVSEIRQGDYSDASYQALQNTLAKAKALTNESTDAELTAAYEALTAAKNGLKTARTTVTTSSDPANSGILTGGGKYAVGETITLTAKAVSGYKFLGWYLGDAENAESTDTTYEVTVTESTAAELNYIAKYTSNEKKKLSMTVGNGTVAYSYQNGTQTGIWSNSFTDNEFAKGTYFTVTAKPIQGYTFLYWINSAGRVLTESETYSFYLGDDLKLEACYKTAVANQHYVIFKDMNGKVLWAGDVEMNQTDDAGATYYGTVTLPDHGTFAGYTFSGWKDASGKEISIDDETGKVKIAEDIVIYADYEAVTGLKLTVDGVEQSTTYAYASKVTVTADESRDGYYFSGWYIGEKLVSDSREYTFYITGDTSLTAKYEGNTVIVQQPLVNMTMSERTKLDNGKQTLVMNVTWSVPEGYTFAGAGLILTQNAEQTSNLKLENVGSNGIVKVFTKLTTSEGLYSYTLSMGAATQAKDVYAVGYMTYKNDATGEVFTSYTEVFTSPVINSNAAN